MGDKELTLDCRMELSKNDMKTSTQIGLPYSPARTVSYEKAPMPEIPKVRIDKTYTVGNIYTASEGYRSTYRENFKMPQTEGTVNVMKEKFANPTREYSKFGNYCVPKTFGLTEYKSEYPEKPLPPCMKGISVGEEATCPMVVTGRDERDPLPLTGNYNKYLDIYVSTTRMAHRPFTLHEQTSIAFKDIVTSQETMDIPKGRGFGCKFPAFAGQDLDKRDKRMTDKAFFKHEHTLRYIPRGMPKVPNFGSESETQAAYTKPEGYAIPHLFDKFIEYPEAIITPTAKQNLCPPGMYTTESYAINNHCSPQKVV